MSDLHTLPTGSWPSKAIRNNGPTDLAIERLKLRELAEGFPCYRDACEWENLRSIFQPGAFIYTTWTGRTPIETFIAASQRGMDAGSFVMHRVHGSTTDINVTATRAVTKMKSTITQRFVLDGGIEVDSESDCRFCYFWSKDAETGKWGAKFLRHWYEKDKLIPVNPNKIPVLDEEKLKFYPTGYRYLAYCQELTLGVKIKLDMPGHRRENGNSNGKAHDELYLQACAWLEGEDVDI